MSARNAAERWERSAPTVGTDAAAPGDPITVLIVRTLAAGAWLQARPGGRLWCSDPARLPPGLRRDLQRNREAVWELVRAGERIGGVVRA